MLYFGNTTSSEGRYWKDYRSAPRSLNGQETIGFTVPLDLNSTLIGVNFYSGAAPAGVNVEVRIAIDGETYGKTFKIGETSGNGLDISEALDSGGALGGHSMIIDPLHVIGIAP